MTHAPLPIAVWDLPTRVFHWLLPVLVLSAWLSYRFAEVIGDETLVWHRWNGLSVLTLVVWRLMWGFLGPRPVQWRSFVRGTGHVLDYIRGLLTGAAGRYLSHNPLGACMILALITSLLAQASLGLFSTDENELTGGPLYRLVSEHGNAFATRWHGRIFDYVLLPLIAIHIAANVLYGVLKREPLIPAMITGRKPAGTYVDADWQTGQAATRVLLRAACCFIAATGLVIGGILAAGGRL